MKLSYLAKRVQFDNAEECSILLDSNEMPVMETSLYTVRKLRSKGDAANTIYNKICALAVLYTWLDQKNKNINLRLTRGEYFNEDELEDLKDFCEKNFSLSSISEITKIKVIKVVQPSIRKKKISTMRIVETPSVANTTKYSRMTYIGYYLKWLSQFLLNMSQQTVDANSRAEIRDMIDLFMSGRPSKKGGGYKEKSLSLEQQAEVIKYFDVDTDEKTNHNNPFKDRGVQVRNKVVFSLLYYLGLRLGELLGIKLEDINFQENTITIERRPDDPDDDRAVKAHQKTNARDLPMKDSLVKLLHVYIIEYRQKVKNSTKNPYLLISHHGSRSIEGSELSASSVHNLFTQVRNMCEILSDFHPHMLRHTSNDNFSNWLDSLSDNKKYSREEEMELRSMIYGWSKNSKMSAKYDKRHIKKKANEALLNLQKKQTPEAILKAKKKRDIDNG